MKIRCLPLAAALAAAVLPCAAMAQASAPAPIAAASASPAAKPGPKRLTPEQLRDSATAPGDLRPEHQVRPQISIPLGRAQPAPLKPPSGAVRRATATTTGGIDDAAARCEAESVEQARASCRAALAREDRKR